MCNSSCTTQHYLSTIVWQQCRCPPLLGSLPHFGEWPGRRGLPRPPYRASTLPFRASRCWVGSPTASTEVSILTVPISATAPTRGIKQPADLHQVCSLGGPGEGSPTPPADSTSGSWATLVALRGSHQPGAPHSDSVCIGRFPLPCPWTPRYRGQSRCLVPCNGW